MTSCLAFSVILTTTESGNFKGGLEIRKFSILFTIKEWKKGLILFLFLLKLLFPSKILKTFPSLLLTHVGIKQLLVGMYEICFEHLNSEYPKCESIIYCSEISLNVCIKQNSLTFCWTLVLIYKSFQVSICGSHTNLNKTFLKS